MKYVIFAVSSLLFISICSRAQISSDSLLRQLAAQHQYVLLDSLNQHGVSTYEEYYKALFANVCNKPAQSNVHLDRFIAESQRDSFDCFKLRYDNYVKLFDYKRAAALGEQLMTKFKSYYSTDDYEEELNAMRIWQSLESVSPQTIQGFESVELATKRDLAGLLNVEVASREVKSDFIFDTGAGMSCITESVAQLMQVELLPDKDVRVQSFTGQKNKVRIGVAKEMRIGELKVENVVFLVYPDSAFSFAKGKYQIHGIVGFPVAKELGTITFTEGELTCKKSEKTDVQPKNLFVDGLRVFVMMNYRGLTLPFNFDSGATSSSFTKAFYEAFESDLKKEGRLEKVKAAGAGGEEISTDALVLANQKMMLGNAEFALPEMVVELNDYGIYGEANYGNIGQDVIGQFRKVTFSFDGNYMLLER